MLETIWQDVRHGARMLAKNPGFSLVAVLSIAIGVGANTAMFSVADGLILRPLQIPDANGLVSVSGITPTGEVRNGGTSYPDYADLRDRARSFDGLAASDGLVAGLARDRDQSAQGRFGLAVSANFFDVLRVQPALGRAFLATEEAVSGREAVVVLGHDTWIDQFGGDPAIVGQTVRLTGQAFVVIGVAPEGFKGAEFFLTPAFYVPLAMLPALRPGAPARPPRGSGGSNAWRHRQAGARHVSGTGQRGGDPHRTQAAAAVPRDQRAPRDAASARNGCPVRRIRADGGAQRHPDRPGPGRPLSSRAPTSRGS